MACILHPAFLSCLFCCLWLRFKKKIDRHVFTVALLEKFILLVRENFGTLVRSCALDICEFEILFRRCSVPPTLELLWSEIVQPRVTNLRFKLRRCGFNRSKSFYFFPLVNHIAREMIHAVCSYYICKFFICMN